MKPDDIAEIEERAAHITEYGGATAEEEQLANVDVPALLAEVERLTAERDEARAALDRVRELAEELAGLAPGDDWGDDVPSTIGADVGRQFIAALDGSGT